MKLSLTKTCQLSLFDQPIVGGHYIFLVGQRHQNFLAYNVDAFTLTDSEVSEEDILHLEYKIATPTIQKLKSETWSCNCHWFFILQEEGIYLFNISTSSFFLCKKHSIKFIQYFINAKV
ncbi:hypothetical protein AHMF7605_11895 [Adhaeribacter arboris]|uniref:Uncharacterized protein n=1 Tax=Adhaeribacter arboris TaxID=2072846 RepID=A0A2T2YFB2_9BACT|nr:hypothetical protein [Adhaeribacter arboris]PSR54173.1 hypothetical protein AHMF7605_11895 [Adhaeribacter arboris]